MSTMSIKTPVRLLVLLSGLLAAHVGHGAAQQDVEATALNELRLGRAVYQNNCVQCHALNANVDARSPSARGFWSQRLNTKGIYRMTSGVTKTHRHADGISPYVFEDIEMLRGAVRYLAIGGEKHFERNIRELKTQLTLINHTALNEAVAALQIPQAVVWGDSVNVDVYSYVGPNYPLKNALSNIITTRVKKRLEGSHYNPSSRGEFEPKHDYDLRITDEAALHGYKYSQLKASMASFKKNEIQRWLNVLGGELKIPIDFRYDPDKEHFTFEIWHTPTQPENVLMGTPVNREERRLNDEDQFTQKESLTVTLPVPIGAARIFKKRLENEDTESKPSLHAVYDLQETVLSLKAVIVLWRDTNQTLTISPEKIVGNIKRLHLTIGQINSLRSSQGNAAVRATQ